MNQHFVHCCLAAAMMLCACTTEGFYKEDDPSLAVDKRFVISGADPVTDTLLVTSNRSWSVVRDGNESWLSFVKAEHLNLSQAEETSAIVLNLDANLMQKDRSASFKVVNENGSRSIVVTQQAIVYRLSVEGPRSFVDVPDTGDTLSVKILTNTSWHAAVVAGSTADIILPEEEGEGDSTFLIVVGPHTNRSEGKTATVVISVEGCTPVEIFIEQMKAVPFVKHEVPVLSERWVDPTVFSAIYSERSFNVLSNCRWTAAIDAEHTTATGVELPVTEGEGNMEDFRVIVRGTNSDMENAKTVSIVFTPEGGIPYTVTLSQGKGSVIALEFRNQDLTAARWPFDEEQATGKVGAGTLHVGGYAFNYYANGYCQIHEASGWQIGSCEVTYIEFPAIAGWKLTRVSFREYNANTSPVISDANGNVIPGGEAITFSRNVFTSFYLSGTAAGTSYRIRPTTSKTFRFTYIELEYKQ